MNEGNFKWGPGSTVAVIGGLGEMGQFFARFFKKQGYNVLISDVNTECTNREVIEESEIVLFSVPLHRSVEIIEESLPYIRSDQLVMDVSSLKELQVKAMLKCPASVVGLHPMFGGRIKNPKGQTIVACPVRIGRNEWGKIKALFEHEGFRVVECSPETHDKMMAVIQVLFHLSSMLKGKVLKELDIDIYETLLFTSPVYRLEISILGRMFAQNPWLYAAIFQLNPHTGKIIEVMKKNLEEFEKLYRENNLKGFVGEFEGISGHLKEFCLQAYEESSVLVEFSTNLCNNKSKFMREKSLACVKN